MSDQTASAEDRLVSVRSRCKQTPIGDLRVAIEVHRANCREPNCPVLVAMEEPAAQRKAAS